MKLTSLIFVATFCLLLAGCPVFQSTVYVSQPLTFKHLKVKFQNPVTSGANLEIPAIPTCPPTSQNPGCVSFDVDEFGAMTFELLGQGAGTGPKKCSDGNSVKWVITKIDGTVTGNSTTFKGSGWGSALSAWANEAFYPIKDSSSGVLYEQDYDKGSTEVTIINKNNHDPADGTKILYYRVTATECDTPNATKSSDPGVENKGTN